MDIHQIPERVMGVFPTDGRKGNAIALLCAAAGHGVKMPDRLMCQAKFEASGVRVRLLHAVRDACTEGLAKRPREGLGRILNDDDTRAPLTSHKSECFSDWAVYDGVVGTNADMYTVPCLIGLNPAVAIPFPNDT